MKPQRLIGALCGLLVLSCGQTVTPRWTPPPGQSLSPLVGIWRSRCDFRILQILSGSNTFPGGYSPFFVSSTTRVEQLGPAEFRMTLIDGPPGVPRVPTVYPHTWTFTGPESTISFHPGESWLAPSGTRQTMLSGSGAFVDPSLRLRWTFQQVDTRPPDSVVNVEATLYAERVSDL